MILIKLHTFFLKFFIDTMQECQTGGFVLLCLRSSKLAYGCLTNTAGGHELSGLKTKDSVTHTSANPVYSSSCSPVSQRQGSSPDEH